MNMRSIALAVACLGSVPAMAQSNVTVYGIADASLAYGKSGDETFTGILGGVISGSRFGFKGSEDLGNGLKAVFALEQGFSLGTGAPISTRQFHRTSWAGLQGAFGTVSLGRQYAPGYSYSGRLSAGVPGAAFRSQASLVDSLPGASIHNGSDARWDNSVKFTLGKMGGLTGEAIYSFNAAQSGDGRTDDDKFGVGVGYAAGPVEVGAVYHQSKRPTNDLKEVYFGGIYDFGVIKLYASFQTAKEDDVVDAKVAYLGAAVPLGSSTIHADIGRLSDDLNDDADSTSVSLAYTYALSKRTKLYAMMNRKTNDANAARGVLVRGAGEGSTAIATGIEHKF